jgi:hypothetical protein
LWVRSIIDIGIKDMAFTDEDRDTLITTATKVEAIETVLFSATGSARCAKNMEKIATIEKSLEKGGKWVKGIVIALSGGAFIFFLTILLDAATKAAP